MASTTQEALSNNFNAVAAGLAATTALDDTVARIATVQSELTSALKQAGTVFAAGTSGLSGGLVGSVLQAASGGSTNTSGGGVASVVSKIFTSGLGLVPLFSGLFGLFGGGSEEPPPLVKYTMPPPVYFQAADTGRNIVPTDYDQMGMLRSYGKAEGVATTPGIASSPAPQITVNVQAMDSRSFMDHSTEIAQAVRQAMLNLNSINDVVTDL